MKSKQTTVSVPVSTTSGDIKDSSENKEVPGYKCTDCNHIMTAADIKNDVKCVKCKNRILLKIRSSQGIEYLAR